MLDLFGYAVAGIMTAVALWRLPSALWGDAQRRALWGCYAGFAAALWLKTRAVRLGLDRSPVTDLDILLKHYVSTAAILAILSYIVAMYGTSPGDDGDGAVPRHVAVSRWVARVATKAALGALALMTVLFFTVVDRSRPSNHFLAEHAGQPGATAYMTVFYAFLTAATVVCAYQWTSQTLRAERPLLRIGLGMMAVAMFLGVAYVTSRVAFIWVSVAEPPARAVADRFEAVTEAVQLLVFVLFALGASVPSAAAAVRRWRHWRALAALYPLWRDLMEAFPAIPFDPPAGRLRELTRTDMPVGVRLDRWVHDIGDAVDKLRHHVPDELLPAARAAAEAGAPAGEERPTAEAYWIRSALRLKSDGAPPGPAAAFATTPGADMEEEVSWLLRVQAAYARVTAERTTAVLRTVGQSA